MTRDRKNVEAALLKKGFTETQGDHHYFVYISLEGKKSMARTKTSHSPKAKTLGDDLLKLMSGQCRLQKSQFLDLVDCPLTREKYEEILKECEAL
jgi:hypothetical protein